MTNKEEIKNTIEDFLTWAFDKEDIVLHEMWCDNLNDSEVESLINKYLDSK